MFEWIASFEKAVAAELASKRAWEVRALDIRPAEISTKPRKRSADAYDFAAHANPSTTHTHQDRRKEKKASATE